MSGVILIGFRLQQIFSDDVQSAKLASFDGFEHLREVPSFVRRYFNAPVFFELLAQSGVLDVLKTRETIRQSAHVAAPLLIVLAAKRIEPAAVFADVTRQQREIDQRQDVIDCVVMLGDVYRL